jgi:hypothetical protein
MSRKKKNSHGHGFRRSKKQWENSIADHLGKFVDRLTMTDVLNGIAFGAGSLATYYGITGLGAISKEIPDWLKIISPLSPFLYQLVIPTETAKNMSESDKVILALLGGYSTIKLAPIVVQEITQAAKAAVA